MSDQVPDTEIGADVPFEELQRELDAIVDRLEHGDVAVDDAIALWQRGEALYRACAARLESAELRIEELGRAASHAIDVGGTASTGDSDPATL